MTMKPLTPRQLDCLRAIDSYIRQHGFSPSIRDLCRALSVNSINSCLLLMVPLERHELIVNVPGKARTLRVTPKGHALLAAGSLPAFRAEAAVEELGL